MSTACVTPDKPLGGYGGQPHHAGNDEHYPGEARKPRVFDDVVCRAKNGAQNQEGNNLPEGCVEQMCNFRGRRSTEGVHRCRFGVCGIVALLSMNEKFIVMFGVGVLLTVALHIP
jgi:hypothetical protein